MIGWDMTNRGVVGLLAVRGKEGELGGATYFVLFAAKAFEVAPAYFVHGVSLLLATLATNERSGGSDEIRAYRCRLDLRPSRSTAIHVSIIEPVGLTNKHASD